ncbi:hypothetical protein MRX96_042165 [Rhipicephalus microplus]
MLVLFSGRRQLSRLFSRISGTVVRARQLSGVPAKRRSADIRGTNSRFSITGFRGSVSPLWGRVGPGKAKVLRLREARTPAGKRRFQVGSRRPERTCPHP